ncbi:MAG: tetratricopeptide repeat protein [Aulosira sp. DedQUE10]|nr:tetratricopeptide repeat protein [Aulosira sp. DedQUE10]
MQDAVTEYTETIRLEPSYIKAYTGLGNTLDNLGKPKEAIAQYKKALSLDPNSALTYYNLGVTLSRQDQRDEAVANLQKARGLFQAQKNNEMVERIERFLQKINSQIN